MYNQKFLKINIKIFRIFFFFFFFFLLVLSLFFFSLFFFPLSVSLFSAYQSIILNFVSLKSMSIFQTNGSLSLRLVSFSQWVSLRSIGSWITICLSLSISLISLVKQRSMAMVSGCKAVVGRVWWCVMGGFVVRVGRGVGWWL